MPPWLTVGITTAAAVAPCVVPLLDQIASLG